MDRNTVNKIRNRKENVEKYIKWGDYTSNGLYSCWNTFDYLYRHLELWADSTTIGSDVRSDLNKLTGALLDLIKETRKINDEIEAFCSEQNRINGDNNSSSNQPVWDGTDTDPNAFV